MTNMGDNDLQAMDEMAKHAIEDLSEYTEYDDGTVDQPFLNHETLIEDERREKEKDEG